MELTYCNPLTIANVDDGRPLDASLSGIFSPTDYRSISDPSVVYHDGKWILYPSYRLAYVTEDFVHWRHVDIGVHDMRYSPGRCLPNRWNCIAAMAARSGSAGENIIRRAAAFIWRGSGPFGEMADTIFSIPVQERSIPHMPKAF